MSGGSGQGGSNKPEKRKARFTINLQGMEDQIANLQDNPIWKASSMATKVRLLLQERIAIGDDDILGIIDKIQSCIDRGDKKELERMLTGIRNRLEALTQETD